MLRPTRWGYLLKYRRRLLLACRLFRGSRADVQYRTVLTRELEVSTSDFISPGTFAKVEGTLLDIQLRFAILCSG